jgi:hypothetical protein
MRKSIVVLGRTFSISSSDVIKNRRKETMNRKFMLSAGIIIILAMLFSLYLPVQATNYYGPRNTKGVEFVWYTDPNIAFAALISGQCDILDWALTQPQQAAVASLGIPPNYASANVQMAQYTSLNMWEFDLNNNLTIAQYGSTATSATAVPAVRQAIACLIDKNYIISVPLDYYAIRIDEPVAAPSTTGWTNPSYQGAGYPYQYNVANAVDYLAGAGFWGDGTWLYYPNATWTGNTLTDGTGVAAGSPVTLDNGGNTITVSAVGTFTVSLAPGVTGTATSSGATLTGSPVTLNTITGTNLQNQRAYTTLTATTTGTFTVTLSGVYTGAQVWGTSAGKSTQDSAGLPVGNSQPLVVVIRSTDPLRVACGEYLETQLENAYTTGYGAGPQNSLLALSPEWGTWGGLNGEPSLNGGAFGTTQRVYEGTRGAVTSPMVLGARNYNVYTGGWQVGRYPTYEFNLYDQQFWFPYGSNYVTGDTWAIGNPDYTTTQATYLQDIYYAPNKPSAQTACQLFTGYFVEWCESIMLWTTASYNAWSRYLQGVVNEQGTGIVNDYTFLNAFKTGAGAGTPIIVGEPETWTLINPLYSQYVFEQDYLSRIVGGTMSVNPYNVMVDQPWMAQDWQVGTWTDPRTQTTKTNVTYWFRPDCGWASPVTGDFGGFFTAQDFAADIWFTYAYPDCWQWADTMDINHIIIDNNYEATVYFDSYSYWFLYEPTYPMFMPAQVLASGWSPQLCGIDQASFYGSSLITPTGAAKGYIEYPFTVTEGVVSVISATMNGAQLTEGNSPGDFYLRTGYDQQALGVYGSNVFVYLNTTDVLSSDSFVITYYYALPGAASGTYLGSAMVGSTGVPDSLWACGYEYPVSLSSTSAYLAPNPYFFMQTPLLGEIKWTWFWSTPGYYPGMANPPGTFPHSGYYRIDILDIVKCTGAYGQRGYGPYDPLYFPGADWSYLDPGKIDLMDVIYITGKYFWTFGQPETYTLGANGVGAGANTEADWGTYLGPPTVISGLTVSWWTTKVTATLTGSTPGVAIWGSIYIGTLYHTYAVIFVDPNAPNVIPLSSGTSPPLASYEVLQTTGSSASTAWLSLPGATNMATWVGLNEIAYLDTSSGSVTASAIDGSPHYAWGTFATSGSGVQYNQVWTVAVSS